MSKKGSTVSLAQAKFYKEQKTAATIAAMIASVAPGLSCVQTFPRF